MAGWVQFNCWGQMAGIGSIFRQGMAIFTGILLIILGLAQINPTVFRRFPIIIPYPRKIYIIT